MVAQHGAQIRGLSAAGGSTGKVRPGDAFQSRFGRMFPDLPAADFAEADLRTLAASMVSGFDPPKDGPDPEESGIPALYTYLGQFIDHDLTFGPEASFQKQKDPDAIADFRTAAFDLDNLYGRGPGDQPYMYAPDGKSFILGDPLTLGDRNATDLQRNSAGRAIIGDPRNDENAIVSQLQGLFQRFHNRVVAGNGALGFEQAQSIVRRHYQYMVINDFLPRIVNRSVLDELRTGSRYDKDKLSFFTALDRPFIPVEFAVAAYRLGHSMVRPGYRLNDANLLPIFPIPTKDVPPRALGFPEGLTGFRRMTPDWGIDWGRFIDLDERADGKDPDLLDPRPDKDPEFRRQNFLRLQFAYKIDTALVDPLGSLPLVVAGDDVLSLALRNLRRGVSFGLPSGQDVAARMKVRELPDEAILIGQAVDDKPQIGSIDGIAGGAFKRKCPLWTYILAEAIQNKEDPASRMPVAGGARSTPQLGPVGGRIVAEVFLGLMFADPASYLSTDPDWTPARRRDYGLKHFVAFALGS